MLRTPSEPLRSARLDDAHERLARSGADTAGGFGALASRHGAARRPLIDSAGRDDLASLHDRDRFMTHAARKPERHALAPGDAVAERYVVRRVLGEGGMGQVLEVEHAALGRAFALKVLRLEKWSDELVRRFNREARALARITTPRVAQVTDFGIDGQVGPFYVMELLEGETLEARIEREGHVPPRDALAICAELCEALAEVHAAGIIHRDLKPSNVGLPQRGPVGVKLLDFGLAASMDEALLSKITQSQQILGSLPYMAPEQFNAAEPTPAIDVYALGVVLYEALTGRLPFSAPSTAVLIHQILAAPVPPLPPELMGRSLLEPLLERLLAKEPHQRFASAAAAGQALREVLAALGGRAHPRTRASDANVPHTAEAASALGFLPTLAMPESDPAIAESGTRLSAGAAPSVSTAPYAPPTGSHAMGPAPRTWPVHLVLACVIGVVLAAAAGVGTVAALSALRSTDGDDAPPVAVPAPPPPATVEPPAPSEPTLAPAPADAAPDPEAVDAEPVTEAADTEPAVRPAAERPRAAPRRAEPRPAPPPPFVHSSPPPSPPPTPPPPPPRSSVPFRTF